MFECASKRESRTCIAERTRAGRPQTCWHPWRHLVAATHRRSQAYYCVALIHVCTQSSTVDFLLRGAHGQGLRGRIFMMIFSVPGDCHAA
jgi:hypothetical protein